MPSRSNLNTPNASNHFRSTAQPTLVASSQPTLLDPLDDVGMMGFGRRQTFEMKDLEGRGEAFVRVDERDEESGSGWERPFEATKMGVEGMSREVY